MKKLIIAAILLGSLTANAQNIVRNGNVFTEVSHKKETKEPTPTVYIYEDSGGEQHLVYLSETGKAFVWMTSKKTDKTYRKYIPEVGKQINPDAYKTVEPTK